MSHFFEDVVVPLGIILLGLAVFLGAIFAAGHFYGQYQCANFAQITGKPTRWAAFDACYIKADTGWERWDEYKLRAAASEGLKGLSK